MNKKKKAKINEIYYDNFYDDCDLKKESEDTSPPERYTTVIRGDTVYVETWYVGDGYQLDIGYTQIDVDEHHVGLIRQMRAEEAGVKLLYMKRYFVPSDYFDRLLDKYF